MDKEKTSSQNINVDKNNNPFEEIVTIVENSKDRAYRKVNINVSRGRKIYQ